MLALVFVATACFGAPSPLAPGLTGSVGLPHNGTLQHGQRLDQRGEGYVRYRSDNTRWGNPRLVSALRRAAAEVARQRPRGAPLVIADMSGPMGGKIPRHRSHRSGRDVDLLFYSLTLDGRSRRTPGFIKFGTDGLARVKRGEYVQLDVARNWLLVKALVLDDNARLQWLFVARWVEALLIEYAQARGEDIELIWRAQQLLHQPGDSFPHADHFHMRIACAPAEEVAGCQGGGYRWSWFGPGAATAATSSAAPPTQAGATDDALLAAMFDAGERAQWLEARTGQTTADN